MVKNPPAMWETWVQSLGWEDHLEKGTSTRSSILAWRLLWTVESMELVAKSQTRLFTFAYVNLNCGLCLQGSCTASEGQV